MKGHNYFSYVLPDGCEKTTRTQAFEVAKKRAFFACPVSLFAKKL